METCLRKSIITTLAFFFVIEMIAFFIITLLFWALQSRYFLGFLVFHGLFFTGLCIFLLKYQKFFYRIKTGEQETTVTAANKITLFRITMLPFLGSLTLASHRYGTGPVLSAAAALTFITDFFDGRIARAKGTESYMGKILDSASDYMLLVSIAALFWYFRLLRLWLFLLIAVRLFYNVVIQLVLYFIRKKIHPQTTSFGKISVAAIMILLVLEAAKPLGLPVWIRYLEFTAAILIAASIIDKSIYFFGALRESSSP
ncbi:MAG: CDP-alcohol phosphatidyltransferase family protein [Treponema sp.]|jgi:phosphatidylglycerophosphate synthase|nr:CDP-alcohol phosphatidyltransferase family protein [Treponema sp.]